MYMLCYYYNNYMYWYCFIVSIFFYLENGYVHNYNYNPIQYKLYIYTFEYSKHYVDKT